MFHDWTGDTHHIGFLKRVSADQVTLDLTGNDDHWNGVHVRSRDTRDRVRRTRATSDKDDTGLTGCPRVPICHVCRCLLVAHQDMLDLILLEQRIIDVQDRSTRVTKDVFNAFILKGTDQHVSA